MSRRRKRENKSTMISGVIYLGLGLYLLSVYYELVPAPERSWPIILIVVGLAIIIGALAKRNSEQELSSNDGSAKIENG